MLGNGLIIETLVTVVGILAIDKFSWKPHSNHANLLNIDDSVGW